MSNYDKVRNSWNALLKIVTVGDAYNFMVAKSINMKCFFVALLSFLVVKSFAQKSGKEIADRFFDIYKKDPSSAIDDYFSKNKWISRKKDDVTNLKTQLKNLVEQAGQFEGYELIAEKTVGTSLKLYSFIVKYDRQPLRFLLVLYKPIDIWQPQNFSYDLNIDNELEEAAKVYRLPEKL
jgi:hypothetical protein